MLFSNSSRNIFGHYRMLLQAHPKDFVNSKTKYDNEIYTYKFPVDWFIAWDWGKKKRWKYYISIRLNTIQRIYIIPDGNKWTKLWPSNVSNVALECLINNIKEIWFDVDTDEYWSVPNTRRYDVWPTPLSLCVHMISLYSKYKPSILNSTF